jgi:hypothetical protein
MKSEELKKALTEVFGYYTDNLWQNDDVQSKFKCTDEEAQEVLDAALNNEWIMEQINLTINDIGEDMGLERIDK